MQRKQHIIADLDGTIAFEDHRRPLIKSHGWTAYFQAMHKDEPNSDLIKMLRLLANTHEIHILTGRCESVKSETVDWLRKYDVPFDSLEMRPVDAPYPDFTKALSEQTFLTDHELKTKMLNKLCLLPTDVLMVFDDRDDMVAWWRKQGFSCCQVREEGYFINPLKGVDHD